MRYAVPCAGALLVVCGQAAAQPTIDGSLSGDESLYGNIIWVQDTPTGFGDNHPSNVPPAGDALTATTGIEVCIPLSALGGATGAGDIRLAGWVTSGDHTFMSNQVIGGLPNVGNLGGAPDFTAQAGQQWITINAAAVGTAPTVDGTLDSGYGAHQDGFLQGNFTGFGDAAHGNVDGGGGSEIDAVYAVTNGGNLYLMVTGNIEANGNGLDLLFDTVAGGQGTLLGTNAVVDNPSGNGNTDILNAQAGIVLDPTFEADYYLTFAGNDPGGGFQFGVAYADMPTAGSGTGFFCGSGTYGPGGGGVLSGADAGAPAVCAAIDNSNVDGVTGSPPVTIPSTDDAVGSEIDGVYAYHDDTNNRLYVLVTGNIQTVFNKLVLMFDSQPGGQSPMRSDNQDIDFNGLNRLGGDGIDPGLTYEAGFAADYFIMVTNGNTPVENYSNAAHLRTDGPIEDFNFNHLDYASFDGGLKSAFNPITFSGPRLDIQDGFTPNVLANYGPRLASDTLQADPFNPVGTPNLLSIAIDNSNIGGVTDTDVSDAANVTTGVEICIDLDELGWDGSQDVKMTGWIQNGSYDFLSNQIIGGLPLDGGGMFMANLGEPRVIDFGAIANTQCVTVLGASFCVADWNGNGVVNTSDFIAYLNDYNAVLGGGSFVFNDPDLAPPIGVLNTSDFIAFLNAFNAGCP